MKTTVTSRDTPRQTSGVWLLLLLTLVLSAFPLCGCHRQPAAAEAASAVPLPLSSPVLRDPVVASNLQQLNTRLVDYIRRNGMPASFDAFITGNPVPVPPPPAGYCYMLSGPSVTLGKLPDKP